MKKQKRNSKMKQWMLLTSCCLIGVLHSGRTEPVEASVLGGPSHLGTFEGSTTFTTSSSNGINPGLYLEVMDEYGNYHEYTSEDGVITIPDTQEGAYVTQAKLLGKTKYRDQDTGELLDQWEDGRNLTLESVQMPVLSTTGKNLLDINKLADINNHTATLTTATYTIAYPLQLKPNTTYSVSRETSDKLSVNLSVITIIDGSENRVSITGTANKARIATTGNDGVLYLALQNVDESKLATIINDVGYLQVEDGSVATSYEPYQSNILTVNKEVKLRGIGDVQDTLDLMTGEVVERIGEVIFDGSVDENWNLWATYPEESAIFRLSKENSLKLMKEFDKNGVFKCDKFSTVLKSSLINAGDTYPHAISFFGLDGEYIQLRVYKSLLKSIDVAGLREYLTNEPITVQYQLESESIKTVGLNSTYHFKPVKTRAVYVDGMVVPLVCSVTVPTEPLSFVLNPNEDSGKQFIAPEFTIENNNPASLSVSLKEFKQVTTVFNDVLPNQHQDWSQLDQEQSKDLALALVPKVSDGWKQLKEGPRYVVDSTNDEIGEIKPKSSVDFTFSASHGPAFTQALSPRYRLVFVFDF